MKNRDAAAEVDTVGRVFDPPFRGPAASEGGSKTRPTPGPRTGRVVALLLAFLPIALTAAEPAPVTTRAAWMRETGWGVMTHYLHDWIMRGTPRDQLTVENWNRLVDGFEVEALADQLHAVGAGWYQISIGQNSGFYLAPNPTYDRIVGAAPSRLSRRDLVADLARALAKRGIKLMVYLPSGAPGGDAVARQALHWANGPQRNAEFQRNWEAVIRDWSERWGASVAGWWFDGCYWPNEMYRHPEAPNFATFAAAARAGNPQSAVAFNPGVVYRTISLTPDEDFIAGEIDRPDQWTAKRNFDGLVDGVQIHVLSYLGETWGRGAPRFTPEQAIAFSRKVAGVGGAITWDTPIQKNGTFAPEFVAELKAIGEAMKTNRR